jgi:hypothetical protein
LLLAALYKGGITDYPLKGSMYSFILI